MPRRSLYAGVLTWTAAESHPAGHEGPAHPRGLGVAHLWQRVQARREAAGATFLRQMNGRLIGRPSGTDVASPYLLSGIAECAECGGSLVAMTRSHGRQRMPFYGCLRYHKRGVHACRNGLQIRQAVLDRAVLDVLAGALDVGVIAEAVEAAVTELRASQTDVTTRRATITGELATTRV